MLNWIASKLGMTRKPNRPHAAINTLIDAAWNAGGTLTWEHLYGVLNHEQAHSSQIDASLKLTAVKCSLAIYTGMVQSLPRRMYALEQGTQKKTRIIATTDHPASRIFSHYFHPELPADDALMQIIIDVLMDGNAYFLRELDNLGRTARAYYVNPQRIPRANIYRASGEEMLSTGRKAVKGELIYRIETGLTARDSNAKPYLVPRSDMIHIKGSVLDAEHHRAHGFVANSQKPIKMYTASEDCGINYYTRGIATQMFLTTPNRLDAQVLKRLEANFIDDPNAPLQDIFRTRVLEQDLKPVHVGLPFQQLQFIETRAFSVEDIARAFNIPPVMLHSYMGTDAGSVSLSEATAQFVQTGIGPFISRLCSQFRTELLPLPSQMLYQFEFETIYLYRCVMDKMADAMRKLFEIGAFDRTELRSVLGMHIDPSDPAANPRYVPVNLMTVEHSLHLEDGAKLANDMTEKQIEQQQQTNDGMVSGEEYAAAQEKLAAAKSEPPSGKMDKSPSKSNIDKRIRNAFMNVVRGLQQYETRVLEQKKQSRPDDYTQAVNEFYAVDGKFHNMLKDQLMNWADAVNYKSDSPSLLITEWLSFQKLPEGLEDGISCTEP